MITYFKEKRRMLDSIGRVNGICNGAKCSNCPLHSENSGTDELCTNLENEHPEKAAEIVATWSKNNPKDKKTAMQLIEEARAELCGEFCKYAKECDEELKEKGIIERYCPLEKL